MKKIGTYELEGSLTNQNAGYSVWGFGKRDGKDYFIKQFVTQKYPANDTISSPERLQKKIKECEQFERYKVAIYKSLNENSDGNAVRVEEFFRVGSKYYIWMRKIEALPWDVATITKLPHEEIRRLCAIIAHGVHSLHKGRMVHADLKHDNVLFMKTATGEITAKIIDFDSSFLETEPPHAGDEIVGDLVYFSPEACKSIWGEKMELTCKMDIFALGVLFHQYFTGELPKFNAEESSYPGEAVAKGELLAVAEKLPNDLRELLARMLHPEPLKRPSAIDVFCLLRRIEKNEDIGPPSRKAADTTIRKEPTTDVNKTGGGLFFPPGDL